MIDGSQEYEVETRCKMYYNLLFVIRSDIDDDGTDERRLHVTNFIW